MFYLSEQQAELHIQIATMISSILSIFLSQWTVLAAVAGYWLYRKLTATFSYFAKSGIPFKKPSLVYGSMSDMMMQKESMFDMVVRTYKEFDGNW